jgi:hypothetical protein
MRQGNHDEVLLEPAGSKSDWEGACAGLADITAFHRYDFLDAVASSLQCRFVPLLVLFRGQKAGVAPLIVKQRGPFCAINSVPFPYLGPLVPAALIPATLAALVREAKRRRAQTHCQWFSHAVAAPAPGGFTVRTDNALVIPLSDRSDEDLMAAMQPSRRQEIRRAQRDGLEVGPAKAEDFELMDNWSSQFYAARGLPAAYPAGTYERVFRVLGNSPGSIFSAARINGRTVGVEIDLAASGRMFGWQFAIDPVYKSSYPQALILWHALIRARDAGASEFDLIGAPTESIAVYKKRYGALERPCTVMFRMTTLHRMALPALSHLKLR